MLLATVSNARAEYYYYQGQSQQPSYQQPAYQPAPQRPQSYTPARAAQVAPQAQSRVQTQSVAQPAATAVRSARPAAQPAAAATAPASASSQREESTAGIDFEHEDSFIDNSDAVRSKQYVRRAILSTVIRETSRFDFSRWYVNHLMGFSAIYQRTRFAKFTSGMQELSVGYVTEGGHAFEGGLELSAVSNIFVGYRYFFRPKSFTLWPYVGAGVGEEIHLIDFAEGPPQAQNYSGQKEMGFGTLGVLLPLVDVGIKAEARFNFYGMDRWVLTTGVGAILFF